MRVLVPSLMVAIALLTTGCPAPQSMIESIHRHYSSNYVAFCGTVQNGDGSGVSGPVTFRIDAVWIPRAWVMTFEGEATLDSRGVGCVNLSRVPTGNYVDIRPVDVDVEALSATVDGVTISGIFTDVDLSVSSVIRAEGFFDLSVPNPGHPGMLAIFSGTNPVPHDLSAILENTRRGRAPTIGGDGSPSRVHSASGSAAI